MKSLTLCADDFGMHESISEAIIDLIALKRIHATSCLATHPNCHLKAQELTSLHHQAHIGLHFNLTEGKGVSKTFQNGFFSIGKLLILSHLKALKLHDLKLEIQHQLQCFLQIFGFFPDYIDGHQHVHHLPIVRIALLEVLKEHPLPETFWIRSVTPLVHSDFLFKSILIERSGAQSLKKQLNQLRIKHNSSFAGVYSLKPNEPFKTYMQHWLSNLKQNGLIMCHPIKKAHQNIMHSLARQKEYQYLNSQEFLTACQENQIQLQTFTS